MKSNMQANQPCSTLQGCRSHTKPALLAAVAAAALLVAACRLSHVVLKSNRGQAQLEIPKVPGVICCKGYAALMCLPRQQQQEQKQEAKADQQLGDKAGAGDVFGFALFRNGAEKVVHLLDKLQQGTQQQHYTGPR